MNNKILKTITKYNMLTPQDTVAIGISGGADSVALLHFLATHAAKLGISLQAIHINHSLRGEESDQDAAFCEGFCMSIGVPLKVIKVDVEAHAKAHKTGIEAAGRALRYSIFKEANTSKIATAHHKNDVAETVLLQMLRGSGGLKGIAPIKNNIIRPFIDVTKDEILAYCKQNNLPFREDSSNACEAYRRNKIRLSLIPTLERDYNPNITHTLSHMAEVCRDEDAFMNNLAKKALQTCMVDTHTLCLDAFMPFDKPIRRRIIRLMLKDIWGDLDNLTHAHVEDVLALCHGQTGKELHLPRGMIATKTYNKLIFTKMDDESITFEKVLNIGEEVYIKEIDKKVQLSPTPCPASLCIAIPPLNRDAIKIRTRLPGDRLCVEGVGTKKIKDYFIDKKVPKHIRDKAVFIACGQDIIMMIDGVVSSKFKADEGNKDDWLYLKIW